MRTRSITNESVDAVAGVNGGDNANDSGDLCGLVPWFLNGTLEPARVRELDAHMPGCLDCREGIEIWRAVQNQRMSEPAQIGDVEAGLHKMNRRLDRYLAGTTNSCSSRARGHWLAAAMSRLAPQRRMMSLAAAVIVMLAGGVYLQMSPGSVMDASHEARYVTLSDSVPNVSPQAQQLKFRVLFHRDTTDARMQAIFNQFNAQVIAGPSSKGVYTVTVPVQAMEPRQITEALRREPEVLVAEWISSL